jgi:transposase
MKRYIGVDLHKNKFTVCYLGEDGQEVLREFKLSQLKEFKKTLHQEDQIAVEATGNSRYFHNQLIDSVSKVVVVDAGQFKVISSSCKKTDKADATLLALYLSKELLPAARTMSDKQAGIKSLVGTRDKFVKLRTVLKNKIHNILNNYGIVTKKNSLSSNKGLEAVLKYQLDDLSNFELILLVQQIKSLNQTIAAIEVELKKEANQLPGHRNLTSIKGIGDTSATVLLSVIGNIKDFPSADQLSSYFGLVPRTRNTNETEHQGRITKRGNRLGRTTLVQCAWIAIRYNPILKAFYERIKSKSGSGKAIIATAHKLLKLVYLTLDKELMWENSTPQAA